MAAWLHTSVRIGHRDGGFLVGELVDKIAGSASTGTARGGRFSLRRLKNGIELLLGGVLSGVTRGNIWVWVTDDAGALPAGNIACTQANAATDTITFTFGTLTIVLTEGATTAEGFARGASNTSCALALATTINAHPVLGGILTAVPSVGNCAITSKIPGLAMQSLALTTSDGTAFAFTQLTGGTAGTASLFPQRAAGGRNP